MGYFVTTDFNTLKKTKRFGCIIEIKMTRLWNYQNNYIKNALSKTRHFIYFNRTENNKKL